MTDDGYGRGVGGAGGGRLLDEVRTLLKWASAEISDPTLRDRLAEARRRIDEPLRVAIAGKIKAGKSTLLNALVGEELAATDAGECTRIVTWYADGPTYAVTAHLRDGAAEQRPFQRVAGAVQISLGRPAEEVDHLEVRVPSARLRRHTLIDTPGIASLSTDVSLRTIAFLQSEGSGPPRPTRWSTCCATCTAVTCGSSSPFTATAWRTAPR
ncbi:hypothetical protein Pflav_028130 [Phytohabitans flavus]|uniref:Dynamin N-terminal domain-containing protein n=1 Tax=Phytohabitans flavus TaxID=1076124 RepID=A0A6F8XRE7_9ACTN|nr:hypothetical protein Pflav_028130 [Phytohabitans flavus]